MAARPKSIVWNHFEITGTKSKNLRLLEESLYSIPPTSVEAERAFKAGVG